MRLTTRTLATAGIFITSISQSPATVAFSAGMLLPGCSTADCEDRQCSDLVEGTTLATNGKSFTHCIDCTSASSCTTWLEDEGGDEVFSCTDDVDSSCTKAVVDAEFAYCNVR